MDSSCRQCQKIFQPTTIPRVAGLPVDFDGAAYCDECSNQRRCSWLNQYCLYSRACDQCGMDTIGMYKSGRDYQVYCADCWSNRNIVRPGYIADKPFWEQFEGLLKQQPLPALLNDNNTLSLNCAYTNNLSSSKNCYFVFDGRQNQDCYYSYGLGESKNAADCSYCLDAELCYELINCHGCYHSAYLIDSRLATDCYFCYDLSNCNHCLFSSGLRNKEYYIFNRQYSKEEYEKYVQENLLTSSYSSLQLLVAKYLVWLQTVVRKESTNRKNENCIGNDILCCKNSSGFFIHQCEDCTNIMHATTNKNCTNSMHISFSGLLDECLQIERGYACFGSAFCENAINNFYSLYCRNCTNIFACIGLQSEEYCILNQQYAKEDYDQIVQRITAELKSDGSFGQFLPPALSPFSYTETVANDLFPLLPQSSVGLNYHFEENKDVLSSHAAMVVKDNINEVDASICQTPLTCEHCNKRYRITEQELELYRTIQFPLPHMCFRCRHQARLKRRPNFRKYSRNCSSCAQEIVTHYTARDAAQVYCHACYEQNVLIN